MTLLGLLVSLVVCFVERASRVSADGQPRSELDRPRESGTAGRLVADLQLGEAEMILISGVRRRNRDGPFER
jgi:hypothetical protein